MRSDPQLHAVDTPEGVEATAQNLRDHIADDISRLAAKTARALAFPLDALEDPTDGPAPQDPASAHLGRPDGCVDVPDGRRGAGGAQPDRRGVAPLSGPICLNPAQHDALKALVDADRAGIALGRDLSLTLAVQLEAVGFARVENGRHFRAFATGIGKAHLRRHAQ